MKRLVGTIARCACAAASFVLTVAACSSLALAQLPVTQLTSIFPPGGKPGTTVEVTTAGADLDDADKLIFNHPGITAAAKMTTPTDFEKTPKAMPGQFTVTIAADVPPGTYEARLTGRFGQSNSRSFIVGTLSEVLDAGNSSLEKAAVVPLGSTFNGRVDANTYDYVKIPLKAGERVMIDCVAERIDSRLNATLVLTDAPGKELMRVRDTIGADPVIDFTAPAEGHYVIKVFDVVYGGGAEYFYRLNVAAVPFVDFVFPPSAPAGSNNAFTIYGRNLPGGQPVEGMSMNGAPLQKLAVNIPLPADDAARTSLAIGPATPNRAAGLDAIEFRLPTPQGPANPVLVYYSAAPVVVEQEPNDQPATAQKVTLPCELVGQFLPGSDVDWVQFDAKKGDNLTIEVVSHRLGLETDPYIALFRVTKNDKGEEVVSDVLQADDPQQQGGGRRRRGPPDPDSQVLDPTSDLAVTEDGTYRLLVRDQADSGRKNPAFVYRLVIKPEEPDFRLIARAVATMSQQDQQLPLQSIVIRKGGTAIIPINVDRRDGFEGDVTISVEGLPTGVTCAGAVVGGSVERTQLVVVAADGAAAASGPIKIVGKAQINGKEVVREARYSQVVWGTQNRQQTPAEYKLARNLNVTIIDKELAPAFVLIGEDKIYETSLGGTIEIPVTVTRRGDYKEALKLNAVGVPDQMRPKEINLDGNTNAGKFELVLNQQNVQPGVYTLSMRADTKLKHVRNPEAVAAAEAEQTAFAETQKALADAVQTATKAKDDATKVAQDTAAAAKTAEQAKATAAANAKAKADAAKAAADNAAKAKAASDADAANQALKDAAAAAQKAADEAAAQQKTADEALATADKALVDAQAAAKAKEEARVAAEAALKAATDKVTAGNAFKQQLDQRVNQIKQVNQPKDLNFPLYSTPVKVKIVSTPIGLAVAPPGAPIKQGEKGMVTATVTRNYNFADAVNLTLELPQGVQGLSAQQVSVPNGQAEGKIEIVAAANATPGDHMLTIRAKGRFNNVEVQQAATVMVKVEAVEKK
jgi:hypothetical protein